MALPVPADLEEALAHAPAARARFDRLPPERKDAWIAWIGRARLRGARRRRIAEAVRRLGAGPATAAVAEERVEPAPLPPGTPWAAWLLALLLLLVIAGLLLWLLVFRDNGHRSTVVVQKGTVPNFVGQPLPQARRLAAEAGVTLVVTRRASDRPPGIVADQRPAPGTVVPSGAPVTLVVSRGPPKVTVPDVTGLAAADASKRIGAAGLVPKLAPTPSAKPPGTVLAQTPRAGAKARRGSKVTLQVAKTQSTTAAPTTAPTTTTATTTHAATTTTTATTTAAAPATTRKQTTGVAVPSLVGKSLASALTALDRAGLLATVKYVGASGPLGQVNGQNPASGTRVPRGTRVQVNVTEGPNPGNPTQVPDVTGEDAATARSDLESAGFKVVVIHTTRPGTAGSVVEQQPAAGTTIASGDVVAIYVP